MKIDKVVSGIKGNKKINALWGLQYWIAAVSYLVIVSLSITCLASYVPNLSESGVIDAGSLNILRTMLIIVLVFATVAFGWEMLQWRKGRSAKKEAEPRIEDIIKSMNKDTNESDSE